MDSDMISNLPENVTDQILVRLPIKDAVRTSLLSTNWRYKWTTITQLVFHDENLDLGHDNNDKLINFIDRVLLLHTGFIHKFELSFVRLSNSSTIDYWILFLSRKNIKEFVLKNFSPFDEEDYYKLPTCFFSAQKITTLELQWCVLKPPPATFTGFSYLKSLYLDETIFVDKGGFECLISKCPLLERLTWELFDGVGHLNICSPNLKYLCISGNFPDFCFGNTPLLSDVSIRLSSTVVFGKKTKKKGCAKSLQSETGNVVKVLGSLPNLRKFVVRGSFLQSNSLRKVSRHNNIENFWEERTLIDWNMSGLQIVKITNIEGFESELEFIKLLLANSPMLEMLSIRSSKQDILDRAGLKLLKELLIFPRASPKAKIQFLEQLEK